MMLDLGRDVVRSCSYGFGKYKKSTAGCWKEMKPCKDMIMDVVSDPLAQHQNYVRSRVRWAAIAHMHTCVFVLMVARGKSSETFKIRSR